MSLIRVSALCALGLPFFAPSLSTDYTQRRSLRIEVETSLEMETTSFEMMIDGEPMERAGMGGQASEEARVFTIIDEVLADDEGRPTEVRREFETVERETLRVMGEEELVDEASGSSPVRMTEKSRRRWKTAASMMMSCWRASTWSWPAMPSCRRASWK